MFYKGDFKNVELTMLASNIQTRFVIVAVPGRSIQLSQEAFAYQSTDETGKSLIIFT